MNKEQFEKNLERHKARGIVDVFEDETLDYPTTIIFNSPIYGTYKLKPFFYVNLMSDTPKALSNALELIHDISPTKSAWNIKMIDNPGAPGRDVSIEFIWYLVDYESNLDWYENNKDGEYCKKYPQIKKLPIVSKKDYIKIQQIWDKYPMTRIENYNPNK